MLLHWLKYRRWLSGLLDEVLPAPRRRVLGVHVQNCAECGEELRQLDRLGRMLRQLPAPSAPPDLESRIRCRISRARTRREQPGWVWKLAKVFAPLAFPASAGVLLAMITFATFLPHLQAPVRAASGDVPLVLWTPPRLRDAEPIELEDAHGGLVLDLLIDQKGHVADYGIVSGQYTAEELRNLRNLLLFAAFDPATLFGQPTPARLLLSIPSVPNAPDKQ